ncbi:MAG: hypothetical protein KDK44_03835, partial [Chlamydiia bacterium]|nr:hypothetical protein [Chlamydiia bacterium]
LQIMMLLFASFVLAQDFEKGFGDVSPLMKSDLTQEDLRHYHEFAKYYKYSPGDLNESVREIPKKLHFIWLGPFQPQPQYEKNLLSWLDHHPDWEVILWTDRPVEPIAERIIHHRFESKLCGTLEEMYTETMNYSERAAIAAATILQMQGGVYVDCDVECFQSIDPLARNFDFFCPIEFSEDSCLSSCLYAGKYVVGSTAGHPVLQSYIKCIKTNWAKYTNAYLGNDRDAKLYRLKYRVLMPLTDAILKESIMTKKSTVLPPLFFKTVGNKRGLFCNHQQMHTVESNMPSIQHQLDHKIKKIMSSISNFNLIFIFGISFFIFVQCVMLLNWYFLFRQREKK